VLYPPTNGRFGIPNFSVFTLMPAFFNDSLHPISFFRLIVQPLPTGRRVYATCSAESFVFLDSPSFSVSSSFSRIHVTFISTPSSFSQRSFSSTIYFVVTNSSLIGIDVITTEVHLVLFGSCLFLLC